MGLGAAMEGRRPANLPVRKGREPKLLLGLGSVHSRLQRRARFESGNLGGLDL